MRRVLCTAALALLVLTSIASGKSSRRCRIECQRTPVCSESATNLVQPAAACAVLDSAQSAPERQSATAQPAGAVAESPPTQPATAVAKGPDATNPIDQILADWEAATSKIRRLDCE